MARKRQSRLKVNAHSSDDRPALAELRNDLGRTTAKRFVEQQNFDGRPPYIYYIITYANFNFLSQSKPLRSVCPSLMASEASRSAPQSL